MKATGPSSQEKRKHVYKVLSILYENPIKAYRMMWNETMAQHLLHVESGKRAGDAFKVGGRIYTVNFFLDNQARNNRTATALHYTLLDNFIKYIDDNHRIHCEMRTVEAGLIRLANECNSMHYFYKCLPKPLGTKTGNLFDLPTDPLIKTIVKRLFLDG